MSESNKVREILCESSPECELTTKLDMYKLCVEMADRISARRLTANSFFLTINTALVALVGYLSLANKKGLEVTQYWVIAIAGISLCYMWYRQIKSYSGLNSAKFEVIHQMEKDLPYRMFDAEWEAVGRGKDPKKYLPFTEIEMFIPWVFLLLHLVVLIKSVPWSNFFSLFS